MNTFIFLLLLSLSNTNITGYWREVGRSTPSGTPVSFTDTTFYEFKIGNEWLRGRSNSFQYRGVYKLDDKTLDLGVEQFKIISMSDNKMVLQSPEAQYTLVRYQPPVIDPAKANRHDASTGRAYDETTYRPVSNLKAIAGKWQPFKRTSAQTLQKVDYKTLIKTFVIYKAPVNGKMGEVYATLDPNDAPSWYIESFHKNEVTAVGKDGNRRTIRVLSFKDDILILQEGPITYFLKQF